MFPTKEKSIAGHLINQYGPERRHCLILDNYSGKVSTTYIYDEKSYIIYATVVGRKFFTELKHTKILGSQIFSVFIFGTKFQKSTPAM